MKRIVSAVTIFMFLLSAFGCASVSAPEDFVVSDGVLIKYTGRAGEAVIPDGVSEIGEEAFDFNPHIYGTRDDRTPGVYNGGKYDNVSFRLIYDGQELPLVMEYLTDNWDGEDHWKTHLNRDGDGPWFEANRDYDPRLVLVAELRGVTVSFDPVPVKPEWMEP